MKKIILILCLNYVLLFSQTIDEQIASAKELFANHQYQQVVDILTKLPVEYTADSDINFIIGKSYFYLQDYETAVVYFERILIMNEDDLRVIAELGLTYAKLGMISEALEKFNYILQQNIPQNVRQNILIQIKQIKASQNKTKFFGSFSVVLAYDTNINNVTDAKTFDTVMFQGLEVTDQQYADTYMLGMLNLNLVYKLNDYYNITNKANLTTQLFQKDSLRLNNSEAPAGSIEKEPKKQLQFGFYAIQIDKISKIDKISFELKYSTIKIDSNPYMNLSSATVSYTKQYLQSIYSALAFTYTSKAYEDPDNQILDSNIYELSLRQMWPTLYYGKFSLGYKYSSEKMKQNDTNNNSDKQTTSLIISNQYPLATNWNFVTTYNKNNAIYKTIDPTFGIKREDVYNMLEAGVSFNMTKTCSISSTIKQVVNNSNISIYAYDKYIATITFRKSF